MYNIQKVQKVDRSSKYPILHVAYTNKRKDQVNKVLIWEIDSSLCNKLITIVNYHLESCLICIVH